MKGLDGLEIGDWRKNTRTEIPLEKQNEKLPEEEMEIEATVRAQPRIPRMAWPSPLK